MDGKKLLLGALEGKVFELEGRPPLSVARSGNSLVLSWPASVSAQVIQSSVSLSTDFVDFDPQPAVIVNGDLTTVTIPLSAGNAFFRLRKSP